MRSSISHANLEGVWREIIIKNVVNHFGVSLYVMDVHMLNEWLMQHGNKHGNRPGKKLFFNHYEKASCLVIVKSANIINVNIWHFENFLYCT